MMSPYHVLNSIGRNVRMKAPSLGTRPDQIRGAAALVVAVAHAWQTFLYPLDKDFVAFQVLTGAAMWAVATFFLLSGMLIAMSIRRRVSGSFDLPAYLRARVRRIFPPLLVATLVTVLCVGVIYSIGLYGSEYYMLPGDEAASRERATLGWQELLSTVTLTYKLIPGTEALLFNGPLWSLVYEFWYYVVAGLCAAAVVNRSWPAGAAAIALCCWMLFVATPAVPFWVFGIVWGSGFAAGWWWAILSMMRTRTLVIAGGICILLAAIVARERLPGLLVSSYSGVTQHVFYMLTSVIILVVMVLYLRGARPVSRVGRFFSWVGEFSYTLYLVHFPLQMLLLSLLRPVILPFGVLGHALLAVAGLVAVVGAAERLSLVTERQYRKAHRTRRQPAE